MKLWYHPVIRELICLHNFKEDYKKLADSVEPPISKTDARKSVTFLLENGMIERQRNGLYKQVDSAMDTGDEISSLAVRNFNRKMIEMAGSALETLPASERYIRGLTVGASRECYKLIVQEIKAFNDRVATIVNSDTGSDDVYHIAMQLFPLSRTKAAVKSVEEGGGVTIFLKMGWASFFALIFLLSGCSQNENVAGGSVGSGNAEITGVVSLADGDGVEDCSCKVNPPWLQPGFSL